MTLIIFKASRDVNEIDSVVLIDEFQIRTSKELNFHAAVSVDVQVVYEDENWSFTDCSSKVVMDQTKIAQAFASTSTFVNSEP